MQIKTVCPYCGVGCSLILEVKNNKVVKTLVDKKDLISKGKPCIKGISAHETIYGEDRIKTPLIRKRNKLKPVSWDEAYNYIKKNLSKLGCHNMSFYGSSPATNEDAFLFQKLAREVFGTNNVDSCARLCHASTCNAFSRTFGISAMPSKLADLDSGDCFIITGSNPKITYPVMFDRILKAKKKGAKIISVSQWHDDSSFDADLYIDIANGSHIPFFNCVLNLLIKGKAVAVPKNIKETVSKYTLKKTAKICNCTEAEIKKVANCIAKSKKFRLCYGMGLTQHNYGVHNIFSVLNLVLAKKGKIFPMRGKANIQGVGDVGCLPKQGDTFISSIFLFPVKAYYVLHSDPAKSLPNLTRAHKQFKKSFLILQTTYPNLTMKFANVVLPSCSWAEKEGTFTNAESRVKNLKQAIKPLYQSKPDWVIFKELANKFNAKWKYKSTKDIYKDIKKEIPEYKLKNSFVNRKISKRKFHPVDFSGFESVISKKYPFILTTARREYSFCSNTLSSRSKTLKKFNDQPWCYMNPRDAHKLKIKTGSKVKVTSKISSIKTIAKLSPNIPKGLVVLPFHFDKVLVNKLFPLQFSPLVEEPNLKRIAVSVKR